MKLYGIQLSYGHIAELLYGWELIECPFCDRRFSRPKGCVGHILSVHKGKAKAKILDWMMPLLRANNYDTEVELAQDVKKLHHNAETIGFKEDAPA